MFSVLAKVLLWAIVVIAPGGLLLLPFLALRGRPVLARIPSRWQRIVPPRH
jgi:hypothetical protein